MNDQSPIRKIRQVFGFVALSLWVASLTQNVWLTCGIARPWGPGAGVLAVGWMALMTWQFAWLANLTIIWNCGRLLFKCQAGLVSSLIGLFIALESLNFKAMPGENGYTPLCGRDIGFWLWIACAAFLALVAVIDAFKYRERSEQPALYDLVLGHLSIPYRAVGMLALTFWLLSLRHTAWWACPVPFQERLLPINGYQSFMLGLRGALFSPDPSWLLKLALWNTNWFANFFVPITILQLLLSRRPTFWVACAGILLAVPTLDWTAMYSAGPKYPDFFKICGHGFGYWAFVSCDAILFTAALLAFLKGIIRSRPPQPLNSAMEAP